MGSTGAGTGGGEAGAISRLERLGWNASIRAPRWPSGGEETAGRIAATAAAPRRVAAARTKAPSGVTWIRRGRRRASLKAWVNSAGRQPLLDEHADFDKVIAGQPERCLLSSQAVSFRGASDGLIINALVDAAGRSTPKRADDVRRARDDFRAACAVPPTRGERDFGAGHPRCSRVLANDDDVLETTAAICAGESSAQIRRSGPPRRRPVITRAVGRRRSMVCAVLSSHRCACPLAVRRDSARARAAGRRVSRRAAINRWRAGVRASARRPIHSHHSRSALAESNSRHAAPRARLRTGRPRHRAIVPAPVAGPRGRPRASSATPRRPTREPQRATHPRADIALSLSLSATAPHSTRRSQAVSHPEQAPRAHSHQSRARRASSHGYDRAQRCGTSIPRHETDRRGRPRPPRLERAVPGSQTRSTDVGRAARPGSWKPAGAARHAGGHSRRSILEYFR